jgi:hypothetical protein
VALLLAVGAVVALAVGVPEVCTVDAAGARPCRPPQLGDGLTVAVGAVLLLLLVPDASEIGIGGLVQIRRRLSHQEDETGRLASQLTSLAAQVQSVQQTASAAGGSAVVNVVNGVDTGRFAVDQAPPKHGARVTEGGDPLDRARYVTAELVLSHLGDVGSGALGEANLRLYLPTGAGGSLRPVFDEPGARRHADEWPVGDGAVGRAWAEGEIVVVRGEEVAATIPDHLAERRARYAELAVIVALPVFDAQRRPIAVVSASSRDPASGLDDEDELSELIAGSEIVARVLIDLLGWASDLPEPPGDRRDPTTHHHPGPQDEGATP